MTPLSPAQDSRVLHDPAEVTAAWLQEVLGRLVQSIQRTQGVSTWAAHVSIVAAIAGEPVPLRLRVKIASTEVFGRSEVDYYLRDFVDLKNAPLVRCHHAAADETHYHLLLDDLTDTHRNQDDVAVTGAYARGLAESLARLHAHRWNRVPVDQEGLRNFVREPPAGLPTMLAAMEDSFSAAERARVADVFDWLPRALARRSDDASGYSWVHGDLNPGNILAPRTGPVQILLIDYQPFAGTQTTDDIAMTDLAHAMVLWWPKESRRAWATAALTHWHDQLARRSR